MLTTDLHSNKGTAPNEKGAASGMTPPFFLLPGFANCMRGFGVEASNCTTVVVYFREAPQRVGKHVDTVLIATHK